MPPVAWLVVAGVLLVWVLYYVAMPYARRFDRRMADKREAAGKPRSIVPPWVMFVGAGLMIVVGVLLMNTPS